MPRDRINVPQSRILVGTAGAILTGYNDLIMVSTGTTGFFAGPITLPDWVDVSRPIDMAIRASAPAPAVEGQTIEFQLRTVWADSAGTEYNQDNVCTVAWFTTLAGLLVRVPIVQDATDPPELFPANLFPRGASVGFLFRRFPLNAGDSYPNSVQVGSYLELLAYRRCQLLAC